MRHKGPFLTLAHICDQILENQPYCGIIDFEIWLYKVTAGVLGQKDFLLQHDSMNNYLSFDTKIGPKNHSIAKLEAIFAVRCLNTEFK